MYNITGTCGNLLGWIVLLYIQRIRKVGFFGGEYNINRIFGVDYMFLNAIKSSIINVIKRIVPEGNITKIQTRSLLC